MATGNLPVACTQFSFTISRDRGITSLSTTETLIDCPHCIPELPFIQPRSFRLPSFILRFSHHNHFINMDVSSAKVTLFEDIFEITALNPDGYKFERVNRLQALGTTFECDLLLDINCEIYSLKETDKFTLVLASTLHLDGSPADHFSYVPASQQHVQQASLADNYEYVMHGRVFDMTYKKDGTVVIAISFGGLLMRLIGDQRHLSNISPDQRLYLLLKKD